MEDAALLLLGFLEMQVLGQRDYHGHGELGGGDDSSV